MRAVWLADILTDAGLMIRPLTGWETRGGELDPIDGANGVIWHHTVTSPTRPDADVDHWLGEVGRPNSDPPVPPPLANISTNRDGSVSIIAAGRANHGGAGSWQGVSGNANWIGDEMKNLGSGDPASSLYESWPVKQIESAQIAAAAILIELARDSSWLCGHKEYAPLRKFDPHTLNMDSQRFIVKGLIRDMKESDMLLPLTPNSAPGDIQKHQRRLNVAGLAVPPLTVSGKWDLATSAATQKLLEFTGEDEASDGAIDRGEKVNALMDEALDRLCTLAYAVPVSGYTKLEADERFAPMKHPHKII